MEQRRTLWLVGGAVAVCAVILSVLVGAQSTPGYDAAYALAWGQDITGSHGLYFSHSASPTPHPLALFWGILLGPLPTSTANTVSGIGSALAVTGLLLALARLAWALTEDRLAVGSTIAASVASAPLALLVLGQSADIPYVALAVTGVLLTIRERNGAAAAVFLVAALLRPEAVAFAVIPLVVGALGRPASGTRLNRLRPSGLFCLGAVGVAAAWLGMGLAGGDPLIALHSAADNAALNDDPRGPATALTDVLPGVSQPLGWIMLSLACVAVASAALAARRQSRHARDQRSRKKRVPDRAPRPRYVLTVGAFTALGMLAFIAQGAAGTPLVARYLLFPGLLCGPLAASLIPLVRRLSGRRPVQLTAPWAVAVVVVVASVVSNLTGWHDLSAARSTRHDVFAAAEDLLQTDLARTCPENFVVRSPAILPFVALTLGRPLDEIRIDDSAGDGVLLQPLTIDAADLAGYGPQTSLDEQARFPSDASPRSSNTHWALYSNCTPDETP